MQKGEIMKKTWMLGIAVSVAALLLSGCKTNGADKTSNTIQKNGEEKTMEKEIQQDTKKQGITIEELRIQNGEDTIYGRLYTPAGEVKHPVIILSHGYNGTNNDFVSECRYFAENGYIAYAYDFCGGSVNSKSTGKSTDMTIFTEKSDLLAVFDYISSMENVDTDNMFLLGGSQGGLVTSLVTEERAEKVKGMILYFPALCIPDNWRETYPKLEDIPESNDFWGLTLGKKFFAEIHDFYVFDTIGSYEKDVMILHGDKDEIVPISYSVQAQKKYAHAELITMQGEGHGFSPVRAKKAKEKVLEFLKNHTN